MFENGFRLSKLFATDERVAKITQGLTQVSLIARDRRVIHDHVFQDSARLSNRLKTLALPAETDLEYSDVLMRSREVAPVLRTCWLLLDKLLSNDKGTPKQLNRLLRVFAKEPEIVTGHRHVVLETKVSRVAAHEVLLDLEGTLIGLLGSRTVVEPQMTQVCDVAMRCCQPAAELIVTRLLANQPGKDSHGVLVCPQSRLGLAQIRLEQAHVVQADEQAILDLPVDRRSQRQLLIVPKRPRRSARASVLLP